MRLEIPYGKKVVKLSIPNDSVKDIIYPNDVFIRDEIQTIKESLVSPIGEKAFDLFLKDTKNLLIIVNDHTRSTPTAKVIDFIQSKISRIPVQFLIATGSHRAPTEKELRHIFGFHFEQYRNRIIIHDSQRESEMVKLGVTHYGTEIVLNRIMTEAEKIVVIGSVEPHYYAGYSGGRKMFLPGIAAYRSIEQNHKLAMDPKAQVLSLDDNPVHKDMDDVIQHFQDKRIFSIMLVIDRKGRIYSVSSGDMKASFNDAVKRSNEVHSVKIDQKADIVVVVVTPPLDMNLYQSHKALEHARLGLKTGGILVLVSACWEGVGPGPFVQILAQAQDIEGAQKLIKDRYQLGYHKVDRIVRIMKMSQLWAVTHLDPDLVKSIFIRPFSSVQDAIDLALNLKQNSKVRFIMNGGVTVPRFSVGNTH